MHFIIDFHNKLSIIPRVIKKNFTMEKNSNKELFKELKETKHKLKIAGFTISIMFGIVIVPMFMNLKPSYLEFIIPSLIGILGPIYLWVEKKQLNQSIKGIINLLDKDSGLQRQLKEEMQEKQASLKGCNTGFFDRKITEYEKSIAANEYWRTKFQRLL